MLLHVWVPHKAPFLRRFITITEFTDMHCRCSSLPRAPLSCCFLMGQTCDWLAVEVRSLTAWGACSRILGKQLLRALTDWALTSVRCFLFFPVCEHCNSLNMVPCRCDLILLRATFPEVCTLEKKLHASAGQSCGRI